MKDFETYLHQKLESKNLKDFHDRFERLGKEENHSSHLGWIKPKKKLPKDCTICWLCDKEGAVFKGFFEAHPQAHWITSHSCESWPEDIYAWQPYFTPEPPEEFDLNTSL